MGPAITILALGCTYLLVALGVVVVYRASRVVNFAAGEMALVSAYIGLSLMQASGGAVWLTVVGTLTLSTLLGLAIYWLLMRHMTGQPHHIAILATIGLSIVLRAAIILGWHARTTRLPIGSQPLLELATGQVRLIDAAVIVAAVLFFAGLLAFYRRTTVGIQMRATADNPLLAAQRGVNIHATLALAWAIAGLAGGFAGVLYGARALISLQSVAIGLNGVTAALVGGLDSPHGALLGALIVAAAEYFTVGLIDPSLSEIFPFFVLLVVLVVRPWGLFGTREELERV